MNPPLAETTPAPPRRGPLTWIIDRFDSVWLGITLMILLFIYMSIASAGLVHPLDWDKPFGTWTRMIVREKLGLTEMEAFAWWPFNLMIALFVINMVVVTLRRIRFNVLNFGVWCIHGGIVMLAISSVYYFGTKLEGDTPVFRRHINVSVPGAETERLVVQTGASTAIAGADGTYRFTVQNINPQWPLLSGDDAGKTACSVNVEVTTPDESFIRQMLIGYPQYTEDILPGRGRAIKNVGRKLIDEDIALAFDYEPQRYFYLQHSAALYMREVGTSEWIERPIEDLPHYHNWVGERSEFWQPRGDKPIEPNPLNIALASGGEQDPLDGFDVRVTGRLHYVQGLESRWVAGGDRLNPYIAVEFAFGDEGRDRVEMVAFDPQANSAKNGMAGFRWARTPAELESHAQAVGNLVEITIPAENIRISVPIDESKTLDSDPSLGFTPIAGSAWSYRVRGFARNLKVGDAAPVALAAMEFKNGDESFRRFVFENTSKTHDRGADNAVRDPDPRIEATYRPGPALLFIGGPEPSRLTLVVNQPDQRMPVTPGEPVVVGRGLTVTVSAMFPNARLEQRMSLTPKRMQDARAGAQRSRIKVEIDRGGWHQAVWLPYHHYPLPDKQYAGRRFAYFPTQITLPDGRAVELMFSRKRWPLPAAITLEDFELKTHVGGFVQGNTQSVRDFVSLLRVYRDGKWSEPFTASLNSPASDGGLYYFQATWDPGAMAYTGLGVGNRNGVYAQLIGCCISVFGMVYVFYIKPIIKRRRRMRVWAEVAEQKSAETPEPALVS
jgi:hypothetical protein